MFDIFGSATPAKSTNPVTAGASVTSDAAGGVSALARMNDAPGVGMMGNLFGGVANLVTAGSELWKGDYAAAAGDGAAGGLKLLNAANTSGLVNMGSWAPYLGVAAGGAQAIGHGIEAANHVDQIDAGYQNNQFWTETGKATWGAASALAALDPTGVSSLYVNGSKLLLDGAGAVSGLVGDGINAVAGTHLDLGFSAGSALGAIEHGIFDTGQAIAAGGMAAYDGISSAASDAYGWLDSGIRGLYGVP